MPADRDVDTAFYYWKTQYYADAAELKCLGQLGVKKLYTRIMDVDNQGANGEAIPVSPIVFQDVFPDSIQLIPVVFIVNNVLKNRSEKELAQLAKQIYTFVKAKVKQAGKATFDELQVDCDWTAGTRDAYFYLLTQLRSHMNEPILLSATLRLHQVRNSRSSGIPPVDRVLLMCYNMGNLRKFGVQNSILDMQEMETYLKGYLKNYPLHLDVALPLFSWSVVFRNEQYVGISKHLDPHLLSDTARFSRVGNTPLYRLRVSLPEAGLRKGDMIRREEVRDRDVLRTARFLAEELPNKRLTLIYYHLDKNLLTAFRNESLQEVIDCF